MVKVVVALVVIAFLTPAAFALPARVLLLRHGEKPADGYDLSDRGWSRARALPQLFLRPEYKALGSPVVLFAQKPGTDGSQIRPFQTLQYVAEAFHLAIDTAFSRDDVSGVVNDILTNPLYDGKFVVLCWEHNVLEQIANGLGVSPMPNYPKDRFDRAWLLTYGIDGTPRFQDLPEHLLPGDTEQ